MDSSDLTTTTTTNNTTSNYQQIPLSSFLNPPQPPPPPPPPPSSSPPSPSFFDPLPSFLPTFHQEPPSSSSSHPPSQQPPPRSTKKRSRASRRAPTTVLTTDTSNFRAMVQEFTGFPAPPFAAPRFDHLSPSSSSPHFLSRPFAHRLPTPSSLVDAIAADAAAYPFANSASMIGIQNHNNILAPPPQLTGFVSNSGGIQQQQISGRVGHGGSLSSWADDQHDRQYPDQFQQLEKRPKSSGDGGAVESWIHSSD